MIILHYISNYVAVLNHAIRTKRLYCRILYTKLGERLTSLLFKHGYILSYRIISNLQYSFLYIQLKKTNLYNPFLSITLISKPSNIIYWSVDRLVFECSRSGNLTQYILSTTQGFLFSNNAIASNLGGQVLFKIN
jgi:ribosomal protein S8